MLKHQQHPQHESIQIHSNPFSIAQLDLDNFDPLQPLQPGSIDAMFVQWEFVQCRTASPQEFHASDGSKTQWSYNGLTLPERPILFSAFHRTTASCNHLSPGSSSHLLRHLMHFKVKCPMRSKRKPSTPYSSDGIRPGRSESWDRDRTDRIHITRIGSGIAFFICCTADKSANSCSKS